MSNLDNNPNDETNVNEPVFEKPEFEKPPMSVNITQEVNQQPTNMNTMQIMPPKKSKKKLVGLIVALFAVVACICIGVFAGPRIIAALSGSNMSPENRFKKAFQNTVKEVENCYNETKSDTAPIKFNSENVNLDAKFTIALEEGMNSIIPEEYSSLKNLSGHFKVMMKDDNPYVSLGLTCNNSQLATLEVLSDFASKQAFVRIPELNTAYLSTTIAMEEADTDEIDSFFQQCQSIKDEEIIQLLKDETDLFLRLIETVNIEKNVSVTANNITSSYDKLTTTISNEKAKQMLIDMAKRLFNEEYVISMYSALCDIETYSDSLPPFNEVLDLLADLPTEEIPTIDLSIYVNSKNQINSIAITFPNDDNLPNEILFLTATDEKTGFEFKVNEAGTTLFSIFGSYTNKKETYSGYITISSFDIDDIPTEYTVDFENLKISSGSNPSVSGTFSFSSPDLMGAQISLTIDSTAQHANMSINVAMGGMSMGTITIDANISEADLIPTLPADATVYDVETQVNDYMLTADLMGFLQNITDVTGIDVISLFYDYIYGI